MEQNKTKPTKKGVVVSMAGKNTISVLVETSQQHFTGKVIKTHKKFLVHDAEGKAQLNNTVLIVEGRKISKNKAWYLKALISKDGAII